MTGESRLLARRRPWRAIGWTLATVTLAGWLWSIWPELMHLLNDEAALEAFVVRLGWWGPPALLAINISQIVVAPIPGYAVYLASGLLYGTLWGGLLGTMGLVLGGSLAMLLARRFGRPWVERMVGASTLARWEEVAHTDSLWVWGLLLLSPIGDSPFYLAGLARVGMGRIILLAAITRTPQAFVVAAMGRGVLVLEWWQISLLTLLLALPILFFMRYQDRVQHWLRRTMAESGANETDAK